PAAVRSEPRAGSSRVGARRGTGLPTRPFPRSALRTGRAGWPRIRLSTCSCQSVTVWSLSSSPTARNRCSPIAVACDGYRRRLEQTHLVLLRPPLPGVAPSQYSHARLGVFVAQPAPHSPPGEGGEEGEGFGRCPVTVVVRPSTQHKVESVQQDGEGLVRGSARRVTRFGLDRGKSGSGRIGV